MLAPDPIALGASDTEELATAAEQFDALFLNERWKESEAVLDRTAHLQDAFDHQFRRMLYSIYTADEEGLDATISRMHAVYGERIVFHLYNGYCEEHGIPNRASKV